MMASPHNGNCLIFIVATLIAEVLFKQFLIHNEVEHIADNEA